MWATDRHEVLGAAARAAGFRSADRAAGFLAAVRAAGFLAACATALDRPADDPEDPVPPDAARCPVASAGRAGCPELISLDVAPAARTAGPLPDMTPAVATPATVAARATAAPAARAMPRRPGRRQRFVRGSLPGLGWPGRLP